MSGKSGDETEQRVKTVQELMRVKDGLEVSEEEAIERALKFYINEHKVVKRSGNTVTTPSSSLTDAGRLSEYPLQTNTRPLNDPFPEGQFDE